MLRSEVFFVAFMKKPLVPTLTLNGTVPGS
jgi:hypothetical protein